MTPEELAIKMRAIKGALDMLYQLQQHLDERKAALSLELNSLSTLYDSMQNFPDPQLSDANAVNELKGYGVDVDLLPPLEKPDVHKLLNKVRHIHVKYNVKAEPGSEVEQVTLEMVDKFSENLAAAEPKVHALFTMLDLDQKLDFIRAYRKNDDAAMLRLLHLEKSA